MSKKASSTEALAAAGHSSTMNRRMMDRNDLKLATQPSEEVMNALFEQVVVRSGEDTSSL